LRRAAGALPQGLSIVSATDTSGYLYTTGQATARGTNGRLQLVDSAAIIRWRPEAVRGDTVAFVPFQHRPGSRILGAMTARTGAETAPFRAQAQWVVAADGQLAVLRPEPYRVDLIDLRSGSRRGQVIPYTPVRVSENHKHIWREEQRRPSPAITAARGGAVSVQMLETPHAEPSEWPEFLPPFLSNAGRFAADNTLWVQRTTNAESAPTFDVFDQQARVLGQVQLPQATRLVGFGRNSVYLVRRDALDVEFLERHRLPVLRRP
jgi:hypothetical protein